LLDNYRATYLVNDKALLVKKSIVKSSLDNVVKLSTQILPIFGQGRRLFKNTLYRENKRFIKDLKLVDVIVVKGFHINIIAEAALFKQDI
jgi:hypothetical protein